LNPAADEVQKQLGDLVIGLRKGGHFVIFSQRYVRTGGWPGASENAKLCVHTLRCEQTIGDINHGAASLLEKSNPVAVAMN
jgi:hypothetical protein